MKNRSAAPLILGLVLQAGLLLTLVVASFHVQGPLSIADSEHRFTEYATLYEASSNREFAYNVPDNHFTPVAILGNASLTMLPKSIALGIFEALSVAALLGAGWLSFTALGVSLPEFHDRRKLFALAAAMAALSAPLFHVFYAGSIDCFVLMLVAAALFLMNASQKPEADETSPRARANLDLLAGAALALATGLNPFCLILLIPALCLARFRVAIGAIAGLGLVYAFSPSLWHAFVISHLDSPDFYFAGPDNASVLGAVHLLGHSAGPGIIPYAPLPRREAIVGLAVLLLSTLVADRKSQVGAQPRGSVLSFAACVPFVLAVPLTVSPHALTLELLMIPVFVALWNLSVNRVQRACIGLAVVGWVLTQSFIADFEPAKSALLPFATSGMGTLILLIGCLLWKFNSKTISESVAGVNTGGRVGRILSSFATERYALCAFALIPTGYFLHTYAHFGPGLTMVGAWLLTMVLLYAGLRPLNASPCIVRTSRFTRRDALIALVLALVFFPPYLFRLYDYPVQINTDEMNILHAMNRILNDRGDWFGVDLGYYGFPNGSFMLIGVLSRALGGITLEHARQVSAFFGVCAVVAGFVFFRQFFERKIAFLGAGMLGASHVLLGLSRMVLRDNLPLLFELIALSLFISAWRRRHSGLMLLGGIVAGLGVYNYFSARIILALWFGFIAGQFVMERTTQCFIRAFKAAAVATLGFAVASAPMAVATYKAPPAIMDYPRSQIIVFPEGQQLLREWEGTTDTKLAFARNAGKGLTMFNNNLSDHGNIYSNIGYGFVDPLTGILLWIGIVQIWCKRKRTARDILALSALGVIWIPLTFLLTKNPCYSRYLFLLPIAIVLALDGGRAFIWKMTSLLIARPTRRIRIGLLFAMVASICIWNGIIYASYVHRGVAQGDVVGSTVRYARSQHSAPEYSFYIVMDEQYPYFWFGKKSWKMWVEYFVPKCQKVELLPSSTFLENPESLKSLARPSSVFMSGELYRKCGTKLKEIFPDLNVKNITSNGDQIALEFKSN